MMSTLRSIAAALAAAIPAASVAAPAGVQGYYRFPTTNGEHVVFACEGDLWRVPLAGGQADRLTTHEGDEAFPRFSPDGALLAFSAQYEGNVDVYVADAAGGEPRRLTFHPGRDEVVGWTPDARRIVLRSRRASGQFREHRLFTVDAAGEAAPAMIDIGIATLADFSADGRSIFFNRLSREFRNWKRYRGGTAQDIWRGDLASGTFEKLTDFDGTDRFPMVLDNRVYFLSDRGGRMNIYSMDTEGGDVRAHTEHTDYDARWPDMHGSAIVYMLGGDLWLLDVRTGRNERIDVTLPSDRVRRRPQFRDAGDTLDTFALDHEGERLAIGSRGEVWIVPISDRPRRGRVIELTGQTSGVRERAPAFSPDGERVALITDETGEQEIALLSAAGAEPVRRLTDARKGWIFKPVWSPTGEHLAYGDLEHRLWIIDAETGERSRVETQARWEITDYRFSPDGRWLAYTSADEPWSWRRSIWVHSLETGESRAVTSNWTGDFEPRWDPEGRYLFFLSSRHINPVIGDRDFEHVSLKTTVPCGVPLSAETLPPFLPEERYPEDPEDHADDQNADDENGGGEPSDEPEPIEIDFEGIAARVFELPVPAGDYDGLEALPEGRLLWRSAPVAGLMGDTWSGDDDPSRPVHVFDLASEELETFLDDADSYAISGDGSTIAWRSGSSIHVAPADGTPDEPTDTVELSSLRLAVVPAEEWLQIFEEAWRLQRDFYWSASLAGVDWQAMHDLYCPLVERVSTRNELNDLIGQMIAELGTSHTYVWGGDDEPAETVAVGLLGADLAPAPAAGAYRITRVLRPEPWENAVAAPLAPDHLRVRDGEYIFAINGEPLSDRENIFRRLAGLAGAEVLLTVGRRADASDARDVQVRTLHSEVNLRYRDWCRRKLEYVRATSDGRFGYLHLPNMGGDGMVEFIKGFYPQLGTEGLVVDIRYNGGGFVSQMIIDRLARRTWAYMQPRRGPASRYPARTHDGHKVVLTNYFAGSDGDIGPESFKILGIGPVIGTRSWGGVVGIRMDKRFIDGGMSTQPEFAWWEPERGWDLENTGVEPDIVVDILPGDYAAGRDPQLDRAIEELERMAAERPVLAPVPPPAPDKSLGAGRSR